MNPPMPSPQLISQECLNVAKIFPNTHYRYVGTGLLLGEQWTILKRKAFKGVVGKWRNGPTVMKLKEHLEAGTLLPPIAVVVSKRTHNVLKCIDGHHRTAAHWLIGANGIWATMWVEQ